MTVKNNSFKEWEILPGEEAYIKLGFSIDWTSSKNSNIMMYNETSITFLIGYIHRFKLLRFHIARK